MGFDWVCQKKAELLILELLDQATSLNEQLKQFQEDLLKKASSRLIDWTDHIVVGNDLDLKQNIIQAGFELRLKALDYEIYCHNGAQLPRIIIKEDPKKLLGISIVVEKIDDFLGVRGISKAVEGSILSAFRRCLIALENEISFWIIERRGTQLIDPTYVEEAHAFKYLSALESWKTRSRSLDHEEYDIKEAITLAKGISLQFGTDMAAFIVLEAERFYWQARNFAGAVQKVRQDALGLGWANHDHHTFRCSRKNYHLVIELFETLGFTCRERFYAGKEAGWGAQVMENPRARFVLFLDVDLSPEEIEIDFTKSVLKPLDKLNTVGLWCALHGESIGKAGMHHLEAQFSFDKLTEDLNQLGISSMTPFSNFSYLRQAFTKGQLWPVDHFRLKELLKEGQISKEQKEHFEKEGALGSHLENLERNEGFKGFNKHNVSSIIQKTDPRLQ